MAVMRSIRLLLCGATLGALLLPFTAAQAAERVTSSQRQAAEEFLNAVATGDPAAVAYAIHPAELEALRTRILTQLRAEAQRGDSTLRGRLFGAGMPLADLERLTALNFYATLARRLHLVGRQFASQEGLDAIPDGQVVHVVVRGRQPRDRGDTRVVNLVTLKPYGKDWKAVVPLEIEAQIEDLAAGRRPAGALAAAAATSAAQGARGSAPDTPPGILELLNGAEKTLTDGKCDVYYREHMSPNFRRVMAKKALETLISSCQNSLGTREMLVSTLRIVRSLQPRFEYEGQRAVYDVSRQGLPFERFTLEQVDKRWYIAE
jgi:hypothetical protein